MRWQFIVEEHKDENDIFGAYFYGKNESQVKGGCISIIRQQISTEGGIVSLKHPISWRTNLAFHRDTWHWPWTCFCSWHTALMKITQFVWLTCLLLRFHVLGAIPAFTSGPVCRDFPRQSHSVDVRRDFSRWSHQTCWVRGRKSDLGLVIDIVQLFSSNVRMRQMWWHCDLTHSQNHSAAIVPGKWGHLRIQCGRSVVKKIRPLQTIPGKRDPVWTQG